MTGVQTCALPIWILTLLDTADVADELKLTRELLLSLADAADTADVVSLDTSRLLQLIMADTVPVDDAVYLGWGQIVTEFLTRVRLGSQDFLGGHETGEKR